MPSYSAELKAQMVKKMMPPNNQSVAQVSQESGIGAATLHAWKKQFRTKGFVVPAKKSLPDYWDAKAKLAAIIQTAAMNEAERSEYCRQYGLHPEQLDAWKEAFESSDTQGGARDQSRSGQRAQEIQTTGKRTATQGEGAGLQPETLGGAHALPGRWCRADR